MAFTISYFDINHFMNSLLLILVSKSKSLWKISNITISSQLLSEILRTTELIVLILNLVIHKKNSVNWYISCVLLVKWDWLILAFGRLGIDSEQFFFPKYRLNCISYLYFWVWNTIIIMSQSIRFFVDLWIVLVS